MCVVKRLARGENLDGVASVTRLSSALPNKEAAEVAPDGSHLVRRVVIAYEAHDLLGDYCHLGCRSQRNDNLHHQPVSDRYKTGTLTEAIEGRSQH
jgi:hypothetical protein